ncbi:MAG: hypothetical protein JNK48_06010 [Bryobacterales bacterium]|nr:hypothetical protein [Bryobacterales bacterium]
MKHFVVFLFLAAALAPAQRRPTVPAMRILIEAEENYCTCAMSSLEAEASVRVEASSPRGRTAQSFGIAAYFLPANQFRIERKGTDWRIELNNGAEAAEFGPGGLRNRASAPARWTESFRPGDFPGSHWLIYDALTAGARNVRIKGEEILTVEGRPVACFVIEFDRDLQQSGAVTGHATVWIGKKEKYVYQEVSSLAGVRRTVRITKLNLETPPEELLFDAGRVEPAPPAR